MTLAYASRLDLGSVVLLLLGGAGLAWLGWISIQSLRQAMLLRALHPGSGGAMDGNRIALHGEVRIQDPIDTPGVGPCLWSRTVEKELDSIASGFLWGRRRWRTISDVTAVAGFVIVVHGQETRVEGRPTEVHGTRTMRGSDSPDLLDQLFSSDYSTRIEWLPVPPKLTVIGRLERRGDVRVVVEDQELGLLFTSKAPDEAARVESLKGIVGLLGVAAGVLALLSMLGRL